MVRTRGKFVGLIRGGDNSFVCHDLTVVNGRQLEVEVRMVGSPTEQDSWEKLVKPRSAIRLLPVDRSQIPHPKLVGAGPAVMPDFLEGKTVTLYTEKALRERQSGVVDVSFNIDGQGNAQNIEETYTDGPDLGDNVHEFIKMGRFKIPADWIATKSTDLRFTMEFQFALSNIRKGIECPKSRSAPRVKNIVAIMVCSDPSP